MRFGISTPITSLIADSDRRARGITTYLQTEPSSIVSAHGTLNPVLKGGYASDTTVRIKSDPLYVATADPAVAETTTIPLSDPQHPDHAAWLAQQAEGKGFFAKYGTYVGVGSAVAILGLAWFLTRKK